MTYTNQFSTIFRTARNARIEAIILPEHLAGNDPLPKYLEKATVSFPDDRPSPEMSNAEQKIGPKDAAVTSRLLGQENERRVPLYTEDGSSLELLDISGNTSSISLALLPSESVPSAYQTSAQGVQNASESFSIARKPLAIDRGSLLL